MSDVTFVIFGVTGDLAKRYIFPAIYRLLESQKIDNFVIIGVARRELAIAAILKESFSFVKNGKKNIWRKVEEATYYQQLDFQDTLQYSFLKEKIIKLKGKRITKEFDKWLVKQYIRDDMPDFYSNIIAELMTELEGLQVEKIEKGSRDLKGISFSIPYLNLIIKKIDKKLLVNLQ